MRSNRFRILCVLLALAAMIAAAGAGVRVPLDQVPKEAVKTVKDRFAKAEIRFVDRESKDLYEFAMKEGGRLFDVGVTAEGKFLHTKEEVAAKDIPAAVKDAVKKKYAAGEIIEAEKVVSGDGGAARTVYDLLIKSGKDTHSLSLDEKGKILD